MSVDLKYIASSGNVYNLKGDGIRSKKANYHKWKWVTNGTTLQYGIRVSDFSRKPAEYETTLIFYGSHNSRKELIDALHADFELDVRTMHPGRVIWGDYYIDCYITNSSTEPDEIDIWTDNAVTLYCPYPFWIKENTRSFYARSVEEQDYLDFPYDFSYDYYFGNPGVAVWERSHLLESDFEMKIYGPVVEPRIMVNGYPYILFDILEEQEYALINSKEKTVKKILASGQEVNIFDLRNKEESVFQKIPGGTLRLNWSGNFGFDLTIFEERSEPK